MRSIDLDRFPPSKLKRLLTERPELAKSLGVTEDHVYMRELSGGAESI